MNYNSRLELSFYKEIATLNEDHQIYLVQHIETHKVFVKKILSVYNISIYQQLLDNPVNGIPKIYCIHKEDNELILIEEYISGNTLSELLLNEEPIPEELVTRYALELCNILDSLHKFNPPIIHRDIKPSNIIITPSNHVALIDLNAARSSTEKDEDTVLLGTKGYAAPEQYGFGSSNTQTDIYAIGMVLNTMLWGNFRRDINPNANYHKLIDRCTKINPKERFNSIAELKNAILRTEQVQPFPILQKHNWKDFLPPGFRTFTVWHMFIAIPVYAFLIWFCLSLEVRDTFGLALWFERIMLFLVSLSVIACATNYLDIQDIMPLCSNKNLFLKIIGTVILSLSIVAILLFILTYVELVIFK